MQQVSEAALYTLRFINQTHRSIFLTGKAGTGKTTLLREIISTTHKNTVVVAPTGIAALNAGGVTIHSMFQLPFGAFLPDNNPPEFSQTTKFESKATLRRIFRMNSQKKAVIRNMELLVIDEVSMLRSDLLDAIDFMLQLIRKNTNPFGGVQVLFIGDLLQLPPVVREDEWRVLKKFYKGKFFFHSHVVQNNPPLYIELDKIFRQSDAAFISILNNLRNNKVAPEDVNNLNRFVQPSFDLKSNPGYITLTTHNAKADTINAEALENINEKEFVFTPEITGDFPDKIFPLDQELRLKVGAQIMFVKNDLNFDKRFFNGKMGIVKSLSSKEIVVHFPEENTTIELEKYEWKNIRYQVNELTKEIDEETIGTFVQYPIKLAWAITVHKSQGLTFDKAALDVSQVFLPGQAYVAFSRLRSLEGLILLSPLQMNGISNDQEVMDYAINKAKVEDLQNNLQLETLRFIHNFMVQTFDWANLAQSWRNHQFSYLESSEKTSKAKHATWAKNQTLKIEALVIPSKKFIMQLHSLFQADSIDLAHIVKRLDAAYQYFFKPMDEMVNELLYKIEEVKRLKKAKAFYDELKELEDLQTKAVLKLMKTKLLAETLAKNEVISKEKLTSDEMKSYIRIKTDKIQTVFANQNPTTVKDEVDEERYQAKPKTKGIPKKPTIEETFDLWQQTNSVEEIAKIRVLTVQTIYGHFAKLIQNGKVTIESLVSEEKLQILKTAFEGYTEESLGPLMEIHGDKFSWDEAKMYKASLNRR